MRHLNPTKFFISAERPDLDPVVARVRTARLESELRAAGFDLKPVVGCYARLREASFCVWTRGDANIDLQYLLSVAADFQQDTLLQVHGDNAAELHTVATPGESELLGTFRQAREHEPADGESYTYDFQTDTTWVVR